MNQLNHVAFIMDGNGAEKKDKEITVISWLKPLRVVEGSIK